MQTVFEGLLSCAHSRDASKRKLRVVLSAVTEVIREKHRSAGSARALTPTDYFAALMTALESGSDLDHMPQLLHLLSVALPAVAPAVLRSKADAVGAVFQSLFALCASEDNPALMGKLLTSVAPFVVAAQPWLPVLDQSVVQVSKAFCSSASVPMVLPTMW